LIRFDIRENIQDAIDSGSLELETTDIPFDGTDRITSGDRIEIKTRLVGEASLTTRTVLIARDISDEVTAGGGVRRVTIEVTDFPQTLLSFRVSDAVFNDVDVGDVVDSLVADAAPIIGRSQIETVGKTVTININGRKTLDVLTQELAPAGDAILGHDGTDLIFRQISTITPQFTLDTADLHTPISVNRIDDELVNRVRVDGGTGSALDDSQPNQSSTVRVDNSTRRTVQVETRKSEIDAVEIFTVPDSTASDGLIVRLQAARGGSPVDVTDTESDVTRRQLSPDELTQSGLTEFKLPDHSLAPAENPFLIIEGVGSTGHDIGVDSNNNVTFKTFFPFPIISRIAESNSVNEFRRRDLRRRDDQLENEAAVQDAVQAVLRHRVEPQRRINAQAATPRAHRLQPGEAVDASAIPVDDVSGGYIVTERASTFRGTRLDTELTFEDADTI
jgi:hypothetical protein